MKKNLLLFILITTLYIFPQGRIEKGNLVIEGVPEIPGSILEKVNQYQNTRAAGLVGWLPDGSGILITTRFGETAQIHKVNMPGGARQQITFFHEPVGGAGINPNPKNKSFLFTRDIGGGEFYQIYLFDMETGSSTLLTDGKSRNGMNGFSSKGDKFAYSSTKRNKTDVDIYIKELSAPYNEKMIVSEGGEWGVLDWSKDDSKMLLLNYISANESRLFLYDFAAGKLSRLNEGKEPVSYGSALFNERASGFYFVSDEGTEFQKLRFYDLKTGKIEIITKDIEWNISELELSNKGDKLLFTANEDGITKVYLLNTKTNKYAPVKNIPLGLAGGFKFNKKDTELAFVSNTSKTPSDVYSIDINSQKLTRWTYSEVGGLNTDKFVMPELIHYKTFDKVDGKERMIPAFIYKPEGKGPFPVLVNIHGGPEGQFTPSFSSIIQYYVKELGIAVIAPNVRGSTGYGKTYLAADNWYKREESVKDIGTLLDWIETQSDLDAKRVCVYGGSYGGFMVLASLTNFNDRLKCGVDVVGISNFVTFLENTQSYRRDLRRVEYGDERIPEMREYLNKISPLTNIEKVTKPLFVIQGLNDPRVPVTEADQVFNKVKKNGGNAWYLLAKDEGHGFQKKTNRDYMTNAIILFLQENLLK